MSYAGIKTLENKIDPYTRMSLGLLVTFGLSLSESQTTRNIGIGFGIASLLQLLDIKKGGRITQNDSKIKFYILDENLGVSELEPGQTPKNSIDGLTFKGLNGVFKVSDGVYIELGKDNSVNYSFGFGKLINQNLRIDFHILIIISFNISPMKLNYRHLYHSFRYLFSLILFI